MRLKRRLGGFEGFLTASMSEKVRFVVSGTLLICLPAVLAVFSFAAVRTLLLRASDTAARVVPGSRTPEELAGIVESTDWYLPGERTCLVRSLTAEVLLRLYGHAPDHRIGVKKEGGDGIMAHSWLEFEGTVLIGEVEELSGYSRLPPLDGGE